MVLNADDNFFNFHKNIAFKKKIKVISFGINKKANIRLINLKKKNNKFKISISINGKNKVFYASCNFENFIKNLLASIAINSIFRDPLNIDKNIFDKFKWPFLIRIESNCSCLIAT